MPRKPPTPFSHPAWVRARVLERVAAGARLKAVCAEPGMPCAESVTGWARRDPEGFGAAYARAKAEGEWRRRFAFDAAKAQALLGRMAAGASLDAALRAPDTPGRAVVRYWLATDLAFAEEVARLRALKREERVGAIRRRRWRAYDPALADRVLLRVGRGVALRRVLAADPELPCLSVLARWRREQPGFDAALKVCMRGGRYQRGARRLWSPELEEEILCRVCEGESFREIAADPQMPCAGTLSRWMRTRPGFAEEVRAMAKVRDETIDDQMLGIAMAATDASLAVDRRRINALAAKAGRLRRMWAEPADDED